MKPLIWAGLLLAFAASASAQTFPSSYQAQAVAQPGDGQPILPTDFIEGARVTTVNNAASLADYGAIPIRDFAFASDVAKTNAAVAALSSHVDAVSNFAYDIRREERSGTAAAIAMTSASMPSQPGRTSWTVNGAAFQDQGAFGGSVAHRLGTNFPLAITGGFAVAGSGVAGGRVGLSGEF